MAKKQVKFGIGIGVILVSMGFLAWLGYGEAKTYTTPLLSCRRFKAAH